MEFEIDLTCLIIESTLFNSSLFDLSVDFLASLDSFLWLGWSGWVVVVCRARACPYLN